MTISNLAPLLISWVRALLAGSLVAVLLTWGVPARAQVCDPTSACCSQVPGGSTCAGDTSPATQGGASQVDVGVGNPINIITGNKYQREDDMPALPGVLGLEIVRHYNSVTSGLNSATGIFGRGWRLSYETELQRKSASVLEVIQADGSVIAFSRAEKPNSDQDVWVTPNATQGRITSRKTARGLEYRWRWAGAGGVATAGRELLFDAQGKLMQISAPTGEFVTLQRDPQGWLVKVTDPQGRSLHLNYLDKAIAQADQGNNQRFRGVRSIDSPVGRYVYDYNDLGLQTPDLVKAELKRRGIDPVQLLANLVQVHLPSHYDADQKAHPFANRGVSSSSIARTYHYEDPAHPTLLTGITVNGQGSDGQQMLQRIRTWAYDAYARANLSVKGEPARLEVDANGNVIEPKRLAAGTGLEQVTVRWPKAGEVVLTNALGQDTYYKTAKIAGAYRLLEARGAGCASCGSTNVRFDYDKLGRLIEHTRIATDGSPIEGQRSELDAQGRVVRISRVAYIDGKPQPAQWLVRYEYAADPEQAQPVLIASPSVIDGKERQIRVDYNALGQPARVTESGYSPVDDKAQVKRDGAALSRSTSYTYETVNGRSVLVQVDGPLRNGDTTRVAWDKTGSYATTTTLPGGLLTLDERDPITGRVALHTDPSGIKTRYEYAVASQDKPSSVERAGQTTRYSFDALGRITQVSDSAARAIKLHYDRADHLIAVSDAQGYKAQTTLDAEGQALVAGLYEPEQSQPLRATYRWYDEQRRLSKQLRADGRLDTWKYDNTGEVSEHTDGDDVLHLSRTKAGLLAHIDLAPDGLVNAALWSSEPAKAKPINTPQVQRDDFGRAVLEWRPEQGLKLRVYDAADHLLREERLDRGAKAAGRIEQVFDTAGRLTQRLNYDAPGKLAQTLKLSYEGARLKTQTDDAQETSYSYDEAGRVSSTGITLKDEQGKVVFSTTLKTSYGPSGEPDSRTLADGQVMRVQRQVTGVASRIALQSAFWAGMHVRVQSWLPQNVAETVQGWLPQTTVVSDIGFHPYNGITGYTQGNGIVTGRSFDVAGRMTALKVGEDRSTLSYGVGPRIQGIEDQVKGTPTIKARYEYDGFGMLKSEPAARIIKTAMSNEPSPSGIKPIERDSRGRTTNDGSFRYAYTESGQIETVSTLEGALVAKYRYNGQSQRVSKTVGARTSYYLWSQGKLVAEIDGTTERQGEVSAQYLYLSNEGKAAPIAKIESATASGNQTGQGRTLYVHSDQRGQPVAMTDAAQKVVWRTRADDWGYVKASQLQAQQAVMNIRLPGQYFDEETGLHDNWHRSYDARPDSGNHGSYLSPDPIGYPDGDDPYSYVGGDPLNKSDPTGLYEIDVHYYMTYFLARVAGLSEQQALTVALADQYVDDNPETMPETTLNLTAREWYHFVMYGHETNSDPNSRYKNPSTTQLDDLRRPASYSFLTKCQQAQFFGEYLHTFMDTFSHRDSNNAPYDHKIGHARANHDADQTFNIRDFQTNELRTMEMEREVFAAFQSQFGLEAKDQDGFPIVFADIQSTMTAFNLTGKAAANAAPKWQDNCFGGLNRSCDEAAYTNRKATELSGKLAVLNSALQRMGLGTIPSYSAAIAATNRQKYLGGLKHQPYPGYAAGDPFLGILLPIDNCPMVGVNIGCKN